MTFSPQPLMTTLQPPQPPAWLRRLLRSDRALVVLVFVVCLFTVPRVLSLLTTEHFEGHELARIYVAVQRDIGGFDLVALEAPAILETPAYVADGGKPSEPNAAEDTDRVRVLKRDDTGTLMETVWSNDDYVVMSRYHVSGKRVSPVSRQTYGLPNALMGLFIAAVVALALKFALARWRTYRALKAPDTRRIGR